MSAQPFATRRFILVGEYQRDAAIALLANVPLGLEVLIRKPVKVRGMDQNALMWVGPLADIAAQAWVAGRQYSAEVWHENFKRDYLPEEYDEVLTKDGYRKWDMTPNGERVLIGSTTQLTKKGFSLYLQQVEAYGAWLGVEFSARRMAA